MGNVLIIKNNDVNNKIHCYAQESFELNEKRYYYAMDGSDNACMERDIIIFEKRKILVRAITDYIAGMTDGYAMEEFEKLK